MKDVAYKAIAERRQALADQLALLQGQLEPLADAVETRQAEIDGVVPTLQNWTLGCRRTLP